MPVSNVNWRKIIENFRGTYQGQKAWEILVTELIANSLDAKADRIDIQLGGLTRKYVRVIDNGAGMKSDSMFETYHDLGSLHKTRGGTIGFAGIGAKLYIDRSGPVLTETCSDGYSAASKWEFPASAKAPTWEKATIGDLVKGSHGTAVDVEIIDKGDWADISNEKVKDLVLRNYNFALRPFGSLELSVNGTPVAPWDPGASVTEFEEVRVRLKSGGEAKGKLWLLNKPAPPSWQGVSIVVWGKTVGDPYDFRQFARIKEPERISGYLRCDGLIEDVRTSKDGFNRQGSVWRSFDAKCAPEFVGWLTRVGQLTPIRVEHGLDDLGADIAREINKLFSMPEILELHLDMFQAKLRRQVAIAKEDGSIPTAPVVGVQLTKGLGGGSTGGGGVPVPGPDEGKAPEEDPTGPDRAEPRSRRVSSGIRIVYLPDPGRHDRVWIDQGNQVIAVNSEHLAFKLADGEGSLPFYTVDQVFQLLADSMEEPAGRLEAQDKLFRGFLKLRSRG